MPTQPTDRSSMRPSRETPPPEGTPPEGGVPPGDGAPDAADGDAAPSLAWRVVKYVLYGVGGLAAFVLAVLVVVVLLLQTNWGGQKALDAVLGLVDPFDNAELTVGHIDGSWLTSLQLYDVNLVRPAEGDSTRLAHIDTLRLRYRLPALFSGTLHVREAYLAGTDLSLRQQADSTWDLLSVLSQDTTAAPTDTSGGLAMRVDEFTVRALNAHAAFYAPNRDSSLTVSDLNARVTDLLLAGETRVDVDTLYGQFTPPGTSSPAAVRLGASLAQNQLDVRALRLVSERSTVTSEGTLRLPADSADTIDDVDFTLSAQPLAFRDVAPFAPTLNPDASLRLDARAQGSGRLLDVAAEGRFSTGGALRLDATVTPAAEGPVTYQADARVRDLDVGALTGASGETLLSADLRADLEGPALDALGGTLEGRVFDSRFGDYAVEQATLESRWDDGRARLDLATTLRGAALGLEGALRPFDATPTYDLTARFDDLDVGRFSDSTTTTSDLSGTLALDGEGIDLQTATVDVTLALAPSRLNGVRISDGRLATRLTDGEGRFEVDVQTAAGGFGAEGSLAGLGAETLSYRVDQGRLEALNVMALLGDTTDSRFSGTFALRGDGTDPAALELVATADLADSYYSTYQVQTAALEATLRDGRLRADLAADLAGGAVDLDAIARPFDATPSFTVLESSSFRGLDLGALTGNPALSSDLTGSLAVNARGFDPATMNLDAQIDLADSRLNSELLDQASVEATLQGGQLNTRLVLDTPSGTTRLAGSGNPFAETPTFALSEGTLDGLDVGGLLGNESLSTSLNGTVDLDVRGFDPATMNLDARIDLADSRLNDAVLQSGTLTADVQNGQASLETTLDLGLGTVALDAAGRFFDEVPVYEAEGTLRNVNLARLSGADSLEARASLEFAVEGRGLDPETMTLQARASSDGARVGDVRVAALDARVGVEDGLVRVDSLVVRSNVADVTAGGPLALFEGAGAVSDFQLRAEINQLAPVAAPLGADLMDLSEGLVLVRVSGPPSALGFEVQADAQSLLYNDYRIAGLDLHLAGELGPERQLQAAETRTTVSYFSIPALTIEDTRLEAVLDDEELAFTTSMTVDDRRDARFRGRLDLRPDNQRLVLEELGLRFDNDRWELLQEATVTYGDEYRVSGFLLYADDQQIAVDGVVDPDGMQNLGVTIESFRIGGIADLLEFEGLGGTLSGSLDLTGPADAPNASADLRLGITSYKEDAGTLRLALAYDSLRLGIDARVTNPAGGALTTEGYVPLDLRLAEPSSAPSDSAQGGGLIRTQQADRSSDVELDVVADSFNIGWVRPFLDPATVSELNGQIVADIDVGGALDAPVLSGQARLFDSLVELPEFGVVYRGMEVDLTLEENRVLIDHIEVNSGRGSLVADGVVNLPELTLGEFDVSASLDNFLAIDSREYRFIADGDLEVQGTTQRPTLTGALQVLSGDVYLVDEAGNSGIEDVALTQEDILLVERRFGIRVEGADTTTFDAFVALQMDLAVQLERDTWLRSRSNPEMNIQFTGELELTKDRGAELPQIFGEIEVIPERSYVKQFGRRFAIEEGTLRFNGPVTDPFLDIQAAYDIRSRKDRGDQVSIILGLEGSLEAETGEEGALTPELSSEPPMDNSDILCYLATARPCSESLAGGGGGGIENVALGAALGQVTGLLEGLAGSTLGLDVIDIEQDGLRGARVTAGKYITRRLYASVSRPISFGGSVEQGSIAGEQSTQVTLEYELFEWLLARLEREGASTRGKLLWEYAY